MVKGGIQNSERKNLKAGPEDEFKREDTISEFEIERATYKKEFGGFEPIFKGRLVGYYSNSILSYILIVLSMLPIYIVCSGALVGQVYLAISYGPYFSSISAALLVIYIMVLLIIAFFGSTGRIALERVALEERRMEQEQEHAATLLLRKEAEDQAIAAKREHDNTYL